MSKLLLLWGGRGKKKLFQNLEIKMLTILLYVMDSVDKEFQQRLVRWLFCSLTVVLSRYASLKSVRLFH